MTIYANTFYQAFKKLNRQILNYPHRVCESRIGPVNESFAQQFVVLFPEQGAKFTDPNVDRIDYEYAEAFWKFMISGGTDATEVFKDYPNVAKFINKPKSDSLPKNFNTFYGPRIVAQLPAIIEELKTNPESRRAVIQILNAEDHVLLDSDETLEYPCTDSMTYSIRDGLLFTHVHMRSQNVATVLQLDMYLQYKLMEHIADLLDVGLGEYSCSIVSAHIYERDFGYVKNFLEIE